MKRWTVYVYLNLSAPQQFFSVNYLPKSYLSCMVSVSSSPPLDTGLALHRVRLSYGGRRRFHSQAEVKSYYSHQLPFFDCLPSLTVCCSFALFLSSAGEFMVIASLNPLIACLHFFLEVLCTNFSIHIHHHYVYLTNAGVAQYRHSILFISKLKHTALLFGPLCYDLNSLKRGISRHFGS